MVLSRAGISSWRGQGQITGVGFEPTTFALLFTCKADVLPLDHPAMSKISALAMQRSWVRNSFSLTQLWKVLRYSALKAVNTIGNYSKYLLA